MTIAIKPSGHTKQIHVSGDLIAHYLAHVIYSVSNGFPA